jgi:hypothetical protein
MTRGVRASVMELSRDGSERDLGILDFLALPSACDRVWIKATSRGLDLMKVLHVDHILLEAGHRKIAGRISSPNVIVCVRLLEKLAERGKCIASGSRINRSISPP